MKRRVAHVLARVTAIMILLGLPATAELRPGHLIAVGRQTAFDPFTTVYQIDPVTGVFETVFSGQSVGLFGGIAVHSPTSISFQRFGNDGRIYTLDLESGQIVELPLGFFSQGGLRLARNGGFLTAGIRATLSPLGDTRQTSMIVRIDPTTGAETVVASAGALFPISAFTTDRCGDVIVGTAAQGNGSLLRVDTKSGAQLVVPTEFAFDPTVGGIATTRANEIVALVALEGSPNQIAIVIIHPRTGRIRLVRVVDASISTAKLTVGIDGQLYVSGFAPPILGQPRTPALLRVDPESGEQTVVATDSRYASLGTLETISLRPGARPRAALRCNSSRSPSR